jgi:acetylornithine deacetylase/succinyl-diaminopimelate desuccinylase family protein
MDTVELARSLISFDTVAPPGNEEDCARFLRDQIFDMHIEGAEAEVHRFQEGRANLIARFSGDSPGLMMAGHIDVVPARDVEDWTSPPFEAQVRAGRLYGRGAADMKAAVAAMVTAVGSLKQRKRKRGLVFIATAGEESGFDGLSAIIAAGKFDDIKARWGIDGEPTEMKVVTAHKGSLVCRVVFEGRSAHASDPSLGVNSIENCIAFMDELKELRRELARTKDVDLGRTLVTPTVIAGGDKSNVIPSSCEVTLDCRLIPAHSSDAVFDGLRSMIGKLGERDENFRARIEIVYKTPPLNVARGSDFVTLCESLTGFASTVALYGTEAAVYSQQGIPCVVLGPGSVKQAHTVDEFVTLKKLRSAEAVYTRLVKEICL